MVLLICLSIFLVTLVSVSDRFFLHPTKGATSISNHRLIKLVVGALPFAGALEGIWYGLGSRIVSDLAEFSSQQVQVYRQQYPNDPSLRPFPAELFDKFLISGAQFLFVLLVLVGAIFFVTPLPRKCAGYLYGRYVGRCVLFHRTRLYRTILYLTAFCTIVFLAPQISLLPDLLVEVPRLFGALVLTLLFLIFLSAHFAALNEIGEQTGYPVISGLLAAAVLFSYLDWNDNHAIRDRIVYPGSCTEVGRCVQPPNLPYPLDTFTEWFKNRPDDVKARFSGSRYPVYIVAAAGGGITQQHRLHCS